MPWLWREVGFLFFGIEGAGLGVEVVGDLVTEVQQANEDREGDESEDEDFFDGHGAGVVVVELGEEVFKLVFKLGTLGLLRVRSSLLA
jgi:hypothetical protein